MRPRRRQRPGSRTSARAPWQPRHQARVRARRAPYGPDQRLWAMGSRGARDRSFHWTHRVGRPRGVRCPLEEDPRQPEDNEQDDPLRRAARRAHREFRHWRTPRDHLRDRPPPLGPRPREERLRDYGRGLWLRERARPGDRGGRPPALLIRTPHRGSGVGAARENSAPPWNRTKILRIKRL